jgi:hypothetical protein
MLKEPGQHRVEKTREQQRRITSCLTLGRGDGVEGEGALTGPPQAVGEEPGQIPTAGLLTTLFGPATNLRYLNGQGKSTVK